MLDTELFRNFLIVFGLSIIRIGAACTVAPFLSTQLVNFRLRNSLLISWGIIVYPIVSPTIDLDSMHVLDIGLVIFKEIFIGILLGFFAAKLFWIVLSVGFLIDNQRGASMASLMDPSTGEQTSPFGLFFQQAILAIFFASGGFLLFMGMILHSYVAWPVGSVLPELSDAFPRFFLEYVDELMLAIVVLAAPVAIAVFVSEFGLGLMNRFAPQLNVFVLAMPIKSLVGMIVLIVYIPTLFLMLQEQYDHQDKVFQIFRNLFRDDLQ